MKVFLLFSYLLLPITAFAQSNNSIVVKNNPFYQLPALQTQNIASFKTFTLKNIQTFSIYNEVTGFNDTFNSTKSSYYYSAPTYIHANTYRGVKVDSFNPHGAHDLGNAVVSGVFSLLF
ncbi:hypothetical protein ULMA_18280 [Patiriisocius marinus]|uniref:Uncharacterized protein n=1 Tax=Patiriisocius marinus TaxID=1397112 RepID=A0A5J4J152_9FLAO|nr:hypothetical protein [Patiriisocius marinus]GER59720.1 hypothetical protein ULMA_18280 [Patiriisocius marinus]